MSQNTNLNEDQNSNLNSHGLTPEQQGEINTAEINAWTITVPGGVPVSLSEHAANYQAAVQGQIDSLAEAKIRHERFHGKDIKDIDE